MFVCVSQVKVDGHRYYIPDVDAKRYALSANKKLKYFYVFSEGHDLIFFELKVNLTPLGKNSP